MLFRDSAVQGSEHYVQGMDPQTHDRPVILHSLIALPTGDYSL
jgi:hypothetical protein